MGHPALVFGKVNASRTLAPIGRRGQPHVQTGQDLREQSMVLVQPAETRGVLQEKPRLAAKERHRHGSPAGAAADSRVGDL